MSARARQRRHRLRAALRALKAELATLPAYDRLHQHLLYSAHAQNGLRDLAQRGVIVLREPLKKMPFGG